MGDDVRAEIAELRPMSTEADGVAAALLAAALDRVRVPVLVYGATGALIHANVSGHALLAQEEGLAARLARAVGAGRGAGDSVVRDLVHMAALGPQGADGCRIVVERVTSRSPRPTEAWVVVLDVPDGHEAAHAWLKGTFGLTPAETRIAMALGHGLGVSTAAERLGISANTARTHLKRVFHKTGVRRQSQLAVLVVRGRPGGAGGKRRARPSQGAE